MKTSQRRLRSTTWYAALVFCLAMTGEMLSHDRICAAEGPVPAKPAQTAAAPGAASATQSIDGRYLPPPATKFGGVINLNAAESTPYWSPRIVPPQGRAERAADHHR